MIFEIQRGCVTRLGVVKQKSLAPALPNAANNSLPPLQKLPGDIQPGIAILFKGLPEIITRERK